MIDLDVREHFVIHWDQLAEIFGMDGQVIKVWSESDNDFVHIVTKTTTDNLRAYIIAKGGYVNERQPKRYEFTDVDGNTWYRYQTPEDYAAENPDLVKDAVDA